MVVDVLGAVALGESALVVVQIHDHARYLYRIIRDGVIRLGFHPELHRGRVVANGASVEVVSIYDYRNQPDLWQRKNIFVDHHVLEQLPRIIDDGSISAYALRRLGVWRTYV